MFVKPQRVISSFVCGANKNQSAIVSLFGFLTMLGLLAELGPEAQAMGRKSRSASSLENLIYREVVATEQFLRETKTADGISPDVRDTPFPTEVMRLNIAPQLLGYLELHRYEGSDAALLEAQARGEYLIANFDQVVRKKSYDGMIAYALLSLYEKIPLDAYRAHAKVILDQLVTLPREKRQLNTGLMAAMGFARALSLEWDPLYFHAFSETILDLASHQNADGSFPHAYGGVDLHYSAWMVMQLVLIERDLARVVVPKARKGVPSWAPSLQTVRLKLKQSLGALSGFVGSRISNRPDLDYAAGEPRYHDRVCEEVEAKAPDVTPLTCREVYYFGTKTAKRAEYDSRGWSNELGYHVFTLVSPMSRGIKKAKDKARHVLSFMTSISVQGRYPDKWRYPVDAVLNPEQAPFATKAESTIRSSIIFWSLAASLNEIARN